MTDIKELRGTDPGLAELYRRYAVWLNRRLARQVGPADADDVVQETYLRIAPLGRSEIRHPKAFLLQVAMNLVRDRGRRRVLENRQAASAEVPRSENASQADQLMLKQIILTMPPLYRDVFVLSRFGAMTYEEIAIAKGISVKTVQWRMAKAVAHCVARLDD